MKIFLSIFVFLHVINNSYCQAITDQTAINKKATHAEDKKFESNKGLLPLPVDGYISFELSENRPSSGHTFICSPTPDITFKCSKNSVIKAIIRCKVIAVANIAETKLVIVQVGNYFITYNKVKNLSVKKGDVLNAGDRIGEVYEIDEQSELEVFLSTPEDKYLPPSAWFKISAQSNTKNDK